MPTKTPMPKITPTQKEILKLLHTNDWHVRHDKFPAAMMHARLAPINPNEGNLSTRISWATFDALRKKKLIQKKQGYFGQRIDVYILSETAIELLSPPE